MRGGFSLIGAIVFLIFIALIGVLSLQTSSQSAKQSTSLYLKTQGELLARSGVEFAILSILAHDIKARDNCINSIRLTYPKSADKALFDIRIDIQYMGNGMPTSCHMVDGADSVKTVDSNITTLIDVYVQTHEGVSTEPIRFHRRTMQKP